MATVTTTNGSFAIIATNVTGLTTNSPFYTLSDANALTLGFYMAYSNAATTLISGVPVSGTLTFTSGNPAISWPNHGLTSGSYIVLTGSTPSNFTASTLSAQTVYYVSATGLTTNAFELSATPGGSAVTPNANTTCTGYNLVAGFSAWSNAVFNNLKISQQTAATAAPTPPSQVPLTPAQ